MEHKYLIICERINDDDSHIDNIFVIEASNMDEAKELAEDGREYPDDAIYIYRAVPLSELVNKGWDWKYYDD